MSISGISSNYNQYQDPLSQLQSVRQDFSYLTTSLASGNLSAAQSAYTTLIQDLGTTATQNSQQTQATSQLSSDLTTLGTALNSNNLSAAQQAYATLMQDLQTGQQTQKTHHRHHHHQSGGTQNTTPAFGSDLAAVGSALQSGNLTGAQQAYATLMQDLGNAGTQSAAASSTQAAANGQGSTTASLLDALNTTSRNVLSLASVSTLSQALNLYAQVGQFNLAMPTAGSFATTG